MVSFTVTLPLNLPLNQTVTTSEKTAYEQYFVPLEMSGVQLHQFFNRNRYGSPLSFASSLRERAFASDLFRRRMVSYLCSALWRRIKRGLLFPYFSAFPQNHIFPHFSAFTRISPIFPHNFCIFLSLTSNQPLPSRCWQVTPKNATIKFHSRKG